MRAGNLQPAYIVHAQDSMLLNAAGDNKGAGRSGAQEYVRNVKESPMANSIVGLFPDRAAAEAAIRDLKAAGFNTDRIGIVMRDRDEARDVASDQGVNSTSGAVTGGVIGGTAGALLAATGALAVPGVGPFITGGILASLVGGTAGWLIGGLVGMGVPREEAEYYQGRVEQGGVLVTVDAHGRDDEARQILLRNGAEGERNRGTAGPYATERADYVPPSTSQVPLDRYAGDGVDATDAAQPADKEQYPPASTGVAPGTMSNSPEIAGSDLGVGSQLGGVQPSAVSDQTDDARRDDLLHRAPGTDDSQLANTSAQDRSPYADTVTSAGAREGADYNRSARRQPPDRPVTDEDIIADAEEQRRHTDPDLDVSADTEERASDQHGLV